MQTARFMGRERTHQRWSSRAGRRGSGQPWGVCGRRVQSSTFRADFQPRRLMDAIALLKSQHREVEALFEQIADALAVHATIEEKHFYPAPREARTEELLQEAVEEHLAAKRTIADLMEMSSDEPQFDAKVKVLKEQIEHHVEEEEKELFPKVRRMLAKVELEDLGLVMEDMAEEMKASGTPREAVPSETGE